MDENDFHGMIISRKDRATGKTTFYLIGQFLYENQGKTSWYRVYRATSCSKSGKEYKNCTGFGGYMLQEILDNQVFISETAEFRLVRKPGTYEAVKANIASGNERGVLKRRKAFLEKRILRDKEELASIVAELGVLL